MAAGEKTTLEAFLQGDFLQETLKDHLSAAGLQARIPARDCGFFLYHSLSEDPSMIDKSFTPGLASAFRKTLAGATYVPVTLSVTFENGETFVNVWYDRTNVIQQSARRRPRHNRECSKGPLRSRTAPPARKYVLSEQPQITLPPGRERKRSLGILQRRSVRLCGRGGLLQQRQDQFLSPPVPTVSDRSARAFCERFRSILAKNCLGSEGV